MAGRFIPRGASLEKPTVIKTENGAGLAFKDGSVMTFGDAAEVGELIIALAGVRLVLDHRAQATAAAWQAA